MARTDSLGIEKLTQLARHWQVILGLSDWTIRVELVEFSRPWQSGDIKVDAVSRSALLLLARSPFRDEEETLVHELVHLVLWPLDLVTMDLVEVVGPEASAAREFAQSAVFRALEPVTEQLAQGLLKAQGKSRHPAWDALEAEAANRLRPE